MKSGKIYRFPAARSSPPSRGAWIEINGRENLLSAFGGRPPRGGRGLKLELTAIDNNLVQSPPSRGAWIEIRLMTYLH